jgi:ribosomal protein S18 acetylase RimI-like enzyme
VDKIWGWNESYQREIHKDNFAAFDTQIIKYKEQEIGYIAIKETGKEIYIENLLIVEEFQNLGIGKEIMEKVIEKASSEKKLMRLQVFKINSNAQRFYQKLGFEDALEKEYHIEMRKSWLSS